MTSGRSIAPAASPFLKLRELAAVSVSALLVEPDTIWAGRVVHGEYGSSGRGLLAYDRQTGRVVLHAMPDTDVIHHITRVDGGLVAGTTHGIYVLRDGALTRVRMEPTLRGAFVPVAQVIQESGLLSGR